MSSRQPTALATFGRPNSMVRLVRNLTAQRAYANAKRKRGGDHTPPMGYALRARAYRVQLGRQRNFTARQRRQLRRMEARNGY